MERPNGGGVTVHLPAEQRFISLARLTVSDAAARAGMGIHETDALAVAAGVAFVALIREANGHSAIRLRVAPRAGAVDVHADLVDTASPVRLSVAACR